MNLKKISHKLTVCKVSDISDIDINISASGTDNPCSHFETVCLDTLNSAPSSSCDSPLDFLKEISFSLKFIL